MRVSELTELFEMTSGLSPRTLANYRTPWTGILKQYGDVEVGELRTIDLARWLASHTAGNGRNSTYNTYLTALRSVLGFAVKMGELEQSPARAIKFRRPSPVKPRALSEDELNRFLSTPPRSYCNTGVYYNRMDLGEVPLSLFQVRRDTVAFRLMAFTGMRGGELVRLRHKDIDFNTSSVTIEHTKSGQWRVVPFPNALSPLIRSHVNTLVKVGVPQDVEWLFPSHRGTDTWGPWRGHWKYNGFSAAFYRHRDHCGLRDDITPHCLRHTYATMLLRNGVDIKRIQMLLGHADPSITMRIYLHPTQEDLRAALDRLPYMHLIEAPT